MARSSVCAVVWEQGPATGGARGGSDQDGKTMRPAPSRLAARVTEASARALAADSPYAVSPAKRVSSTRCLTFTQGGGFPHLGPPHFAAAASETANLNKVAVVAFPLLVALLPQLQLLRALHLRLEHQHTQPASKTAHACTTSTPSSLRAHSLRRPLALHPLEHALFPSVSLLPLAMQFELHS